MFQFIPSEMFQHDCDGFSDSLPARHEDTRHSHANRIFTLSDKMRLFFAIQIIPGKRSCSVSALLRHILHRCTSKEGEKKKKNHNIIRTGVNCLFSPTGLRVCSLFILPLNMYLCQQKWIVCWFKINRRCFLFISKLEMVSPGKGHFSLRLISGCRGQGAIRWWQINGCRQQPSPITNTTLHLLNVPSGEYGQFNHRLHSFARTLFTALSCI